MSGCSFFNKDPNEADAEEFKLIDENGCNDSPVYYDPFAAASKPGVNGMYLNQKPVDNQLVDGKLITWAGLWIPL